MKRIACLIYVFHVISALLPANGSGSFDEDGWRYYSRLDGFSEIELKANAELTLIPGRNWELRARGNNRDMDALDIYVTGNKLIIREESLFNFIPSNQRLEIEITVPRLSRDN